MSRIAMEGGAIEQNLKDMLPIDSKLSVFAEHGPGCDGARVSALAGCGAFYRGSFGCA
jgi:hypothetical protein